MLVKKNPIRNASFLRVRTSYDFKIILDDAISEATLNLVILGGFVGFTNPNIVLV